ncbi:stage II sporulation protein R [Neobacillus notoginsengisoli]|nr:stage II sporulation protein R [Neobacillus notoginsengisoli]
MKNKTLVWLYLVVLSIATIANLYAPQTKAAGKEEIVIPGEAIRLRILANSDRQGDQELKRMVRDAVNERITEWVSELTNLDEARMVIQSHLPEIEAEARKVLQENGSSQQAKAEFGKVQFPTKLYGEYLYPAGEYEAILITLGEGKGANWWCVLFPPLCFLDFSSGTAVRSPGFEDGENEGNRQEIEENAGEKNSKSVKETSQKEASNPPENEAAHDGKKASEKATINSRQQDEIAQKNELLGPNDTSDPKQENHYAEKIYTPEDEEPVKVKFFVVELWEKLRD